mgnify:CR=1 FL=1
MVWWMALSYLLIWGNQMQQDRLTAIIHDQTERALWEVENVINCVPDSLWKKLYCDAPLWKHIYHMLHSLDLWFINPYDVFFCEPSIHEKDLNNLDVPASKELSKKDITTYFSAIKEKISRYTEDLEDETLLQNPPNCPYAKFTLLLAQHRHLHSHMGMIMGFIIADTGQWPRVLGLENDFPSQDLAPYF